MGGLNYMMNRIVKTVLTGLAAIASGLLASKLSEAHRREEGIEAVINEQNKNREETDNE